VLLLVATMAAAQQPPDFWCPAQGVAYGVSFKRAAEHIVHVDAVTRQPVAELQLPVWNALYQVRDFAVNVNRFEAYEGVPAWICDGCDQREATASKSDKTTWRFASSGNHPCLTFSYDLRADDPGPFGASLSSDFAFFNWAEVLVYRPDQRNAQVSIRLLDPPPNWSVRDGGVFGARTADDLAGATATAHSYDRLVDSPALFGHLYQTEFEQDSTAYHIATDSSEVDLPALQSMVQHITSAAVDWMQDHPCRDYTFLYLIAHGSGSGGMEHACSTAIDVSPDAMKQDVMSAAGVSAHEFFHLWNVKRIRPRSLEPIDYAREQYTRALWFSEGVTNTAADIIQYRAGLADEKQYLAHVASVIAALQSRPAHLTQSAEQSSLETWFDGYPAYRRGDRSVSYYIKGEILGILIDLEMRRVTNGRRCLRDLFQAMNRDAQQSKQFDDSEGVRLSLEQLTGADFRDFFSRYVSGTDEIPYDRFFSYVGLTLTVRPSEQAYPGFSVSRAPGRAVSVAHVDEDSTAAVNLHPGDLILEADGKAVRGNFSQLVHKHDARKPLHLKVASPDGTTREFDLPVSARRIDEYQFDDVPNVTREQLQHRAAFLRGDSEAVLQ
jgi:predicted metalloprotease with PDZ domain